MKKTIEQRLYEEEMRFAQLCNIAHHRIDKPNETDTIDANMFYVKLMSKSDSKLKKLRLEKMKKDCFAILRNAIA